jgi:tRNA(fMet)-specific endonuclease VapC
LPNYGSWFSTARRIQENRRRLEQLIAQFTVLEFDADSAVEFGKLRVELRKTGTPIPVFDVLIAAIALKNRCTLVSADHHFSKIPSLAVEDWSTP